ncbi:MAG: hypothetical protein HPY64_12375 [Anaerolineae bacterium]|nr:hypothetical protein [Anaerolineae bacterium]
MADQGQKQEAALWLERGVAALRAGDVRLARECLVRVTELDPGNVDAWLYLTATTRDLHKRRLLLQKALTIAPNHAQARQVLDQIDRQLAAQQPAQPPAAASAPAAGPSMAVEEAPATGTAIPSDRCPSCGAVLRPDERTGNMVCIFCGYGMTEERLPTLEINRVYPERPWPDGQAARHCLTCEAVSLLPVGMPPETPCPICMQSVFEVIEVGTPFPDTYLPFQVDETRAMAALEAVEVGGVLRLLQGRREIAPLRPVLLPIWLFEGLGVIETSGEAETETLTQSFTDLVVYGVRQLEVPLLQLLTSVPLANAEPCPLEIRDDTLVFTVLPGVSLPVAGQEAHARMLNALRRRAAAGRTMVRDLWVRQMMLPAWITEVRVGGRQYVGLVNGYSGRAALGELLRRGRR